MSETTSSLSKSDADQEFAEMWGQSSLSSLLSPLSPLPLPIPAQPPLSFSLPLSPLSSLLSPLSSFSLSTGSHRPLSLLPSLSSLTKFPRNFSHRPLSLLLSPASFTNDAPLASRRAPLASRPFSSSYGCPLPTWTTFPPSLSHTVISPLLHIPSKKNSPYLSPHRKKSLSLSLLAIPSPHATARTARKSLSLSLLAIPSPHTLTPSHSHSLSFPLHTANSLSLSQQIPPLTARPLIFLSYHFTLSSLPQTVQHFFPLFTLKASHFFSLTINPSSSYSKPPSPLTKPNSFSFSIPTTDDVKGKKKRYNILNFKTPKYHARFS